MTKNSSIKIAIWAALLITLKANAAGFALIEQSASGLGNAYAGAAAVAEDASTIFFNPAGMSYLPASQLVVAGHAIRPTGTFDNDGSHRAAATGGLATPGGDGGDPGDWAFVPGIFYAKQVSTNVRLGIGISAPFGLKTEYDKDWVGRYQAIKSDLKTININPSLAFKLNDQVALGFGISAMRAEADLTNAVDAGTICAALLGGCGTGATFQRRDSFAQVKGDDWGFGWNAGAIVQLTEATRFGLAYRSQVHQNLKGDVDFTNLPAAFAGVPALNAQFADGSVSAKLVTPDSFSASLSHHVNDDWDVMTDVMWTNWSKFKDLTIVRSSGALSGQNLSSVPQNWDDTIRLSVGTTYQYSDSLKLRAGLAYDESPVPKAFRTPRIPDSDRYWLSLGASYKCSESGRLDIGYTHIFLEDSTVNKVTDTATAALRDTVQGNYEAYADILSLQYTHTF